MRLRLVYPEIADVLDDEDTESVYARSFSVCLGIMTYDNVTYGK